MRCEPKRIVGTEIVLACPLPSSRENLSDGSDASIGITAVAPESTALDPEITCAPVLAGSSVAKGRLNLDPVITGRSVLFLSAVLG